MHSYKFNRIVSRVMIKIFPSCEPLAVRPYSRCVCSKRRHWKGPLWPQHALAQPSPHARTLLANVLSRISPDAAAAPSPARRCTCTQAEHPRARHFFTASDSASAIPYRALGSPHTYAWAAAAPSPSCPPHTQVSHPDGATAHASRANVRATRPLAREHTRTAKGAAYAHTDPRQGASTRVSPRPCARHPPRTPTAGLCKDPCTRACL